MMLEDFRIALRLFRRNIVLSLVIVLTFAAGIGATAAMFTVVNSVLIQPLPYRDPSRIVDVESRVGGLTSAPDFLDYERSAPPFSSMAIWNLSNVIVVTDANSAYVSSMDVSTGFFKTVGVDPVHGRFFSSDEENQSTSVVVLSDRLWQRLFGSDPKVIGRTIVIDGKGSRVIGIAPSTLDHNLDGDIFRPFDFHSGHASVRAYHTQPVLGRLAPGESTASAQAKMRLITSALESEYPEDAGRSVVLRPYAETLVGVARWQLLYLLGAVALVLLIACGNIASLVLVNVTTRYAEFATRVALGATRARLTRQLLTECIVLASLGGAIGLALAELLTMRLRATGGGVLPRANEIHLNLVVVLVTVALTIGSAALIGTVTAFRIGAATSRLEMKVAGRGSGSRRSRRVRGALVVTQLAMSLVLMTAAATLLLTFWRSTHVDPGFDPDGLLTARIVLPRDRYSIAAQPVFWRTFLDRVRALPHVEGASAAATLPMALYPGGASYVPLGMPIPMQLDDRPMAQMNAVEPGYFQVMRIPVVGGHVFTRDDCAREHPPIMVSESMRGGDPFKLLTGNQYVFPDYDNITGEVVGVVGDVQKLRPHGEIKDVIYFCAAGPESGWESEMSLVVRTDRDPGSLVAPISTVLRRIDPQLALGEVRPMLDILGRSHSRERLDMSLLVGFAAIALILSGIGLYGLLAYSVSSRSNEFAIRYALGARVQDLIGLVFRSGMTLVGIGIGAGAILMPTTLRLARHIFGLPDIGRTTMLLAAAAMGIVGMMACVVPAINAVRLGSKWTPPE
jgi:putative ABC transport system permease protein